jgi:hypothetical protein
MSVARRPAAYIRGNEALDRHAVAQAAWERGWPAPEIYCDDPEPGRAGETSLGLRRLESAIAAGRHNALLMMVPGTLGNPAPLMRLLSGCTKHGVTVSFVPHPVRRGQPVSPAPAAEEPSPALDHEQWSVLSRARLEALAGLYPDWRIWLDQHGWHARRRRDGFVQGYRPGAPAFHVRAETATDLAAQLCWQQAVDTHAPDGCAGGRLAAAAKPALQAAHG